MPKLSKLVGFIAFLYLTVVLTGCSSLAPQPAQQPIAPAPGTAHNVSITLVGISNNCTQNANGASNVPFVDVHDGDTVTWTAIDKVGGPNVPFDIQFSPGGSPFFDFKTLSASSVTSPPIMSTPGMKYRYGSIKINTTDCINESSLGLIMR